MKRILVVEDNHLKAEQITNTIRRAYEVSFEIVPTISGAYAVLEHDHWDLVILDMTFQVSKGLGQAVRKEGLAGLELLQYMLGKRIKFPVIVATQHTMFSQGIINVSSIEELHRLLGEAFPDIYKTTVRIDLANDQWHSQLLFAVKGVFGV